MAALEHYAKAAADWDFDWWQRQRAAAAVPKGAWRWIESAQYRLLRHGDGAHRALSGVDLLICATAVQHAGAATEPDLAERLAALWAILTDSDPELAASAARYARP